MKREYIKELEDMLQKARWNIGFTRFTLEERMKDENETEKDKVRANIEEQEKRIETNEAFLSWLKNQK